ncbi:MULTISPECIES: slipin family protein [Gordonia]|uniref:Slipin family protein n=1 Tax=Gordonia amicalis TaxID=89053 RepID=A0AAE4R3Q9_9ACTN|nr:MULTISPECIES: slipin family protein [Gordonia]ATD72538.1 peptidase [Gordonia sp. 1D]MCR8897943.1 slipin family protein [Gordonia sp. GONU]MCZ0915124.1 slipin family protein [Gordonia amicalis]MCZ4578508.1 slipin family protein [Gordonia amicalis]MCZ4653315.1 slipin family protein [Gordonia amicalis]
MIFYNEITVPPGHTVLAYRGTEVQSLGTGRHQIPKPDSTVTVDLRDRLIPVAPQEILTSDSISIRVSMSLRARVIDARAFVERAADPIGAVYLAAQIALRRVCANVPSEDLIRRGDAVDVGPIRAAAAEVAATVGVEVLDVAIRDIIVPSEIRSAALEVITARTRGLAKLEAARAETASLRALANAGRLLDAHPALAQLRLIEAVPYGARVVLSVGGTEVPSED